MSTHVETGIDVERISDRQPAASARIDEIYRELDEHGIVRLDDAVKEAQLDGMQRAFAAQLRNLRWSNVDGYEKTERFRHMVEDVLLLDQGFVDLALHPVIAEVLRRYIGESFTLNEAKGWLSLATKRDFHGWHGDKWYDQEVVDFIPREVKSVIYLTDVKSGAFHYIKGSHRQIAPKDYESWEISDTWKKNVVEMTAPAGTVILFDTSGIHRQGSPILEPRQAVFLNYHDPTVRIQEESIRSYRYHPLLLNAAFLGGLTAEDCRILGFGEKSQYKPGHIDKSNHDWFRRIFQVAYDVNLVASDFAARVAGKLKRLSGR